MTTMEPIGEKGAGGAPALDELAQLAPQVRKMVETLAARGSAVDPALLAGYDEWVTATRAVVRAADDTFAALVAASRGPSSPTDDAGSDA